MQWGWAKACFVAAIAAAALATAPAAIAAPPNDTIENAVVIGSLPFTDSVDTRTATISVGEPMTCVAPGDETASVWYRLTTSTAVPIQISTAGSSYTPKILIYQGSPGSLSGPSFCPSGGSTHLKTFAATAYYLQVRGKGDLVLSVSLFPPPPNDDFDSPTVIPAFPFTQTVNVYAATTASDEPYGACDRGQSVWYRVLVPKQRRFRVTSDYDVQVSVFQGPRSGLTEVGCTTHGSQPVEFIASSATPYSIRLSYLPGYTHWEYPINVVQVPLESRMGLKPSSTLIVYGKKVRITVHLGPDFSFPETDNHTVELYTSGAKGSETLVATGTVDAAGNWSTTVKPQVITKYFARWTGEDGYNFASSFVKKISVRSKVTLSMAGGRPGSGGVRIFKAGTIPRLLAQVRPNGGKKLRFRLDVRLSSGYRKIAEADFKVDRSGKARVYVGRLPSGYRFRIRARAPDTKTNLANTTRWMYFQFSG